MADLADRESGKAKHILGGLPRHVEPNDIFFLSQHGNTYSADIESRLKPKLTQYKQLMERIDEINSAKLEIMQYQSRIMLFKAQDHGRPKSPLRRASYERFDKLMKGYETDAVRNEYENLVRVTTELRADIQKLHMQAYDKAHGALEFVGSSVTVGAPACA